MHGIQAWRNTRPRKHQVLQMEEERTHLSRREGGTHLWHCVVVRKVVRVYG